MKRCHRCKTPWHEEKRQPAYKDCCEKCSAYLHCCLNCRYHDPSAHNQCYIPTTDWVGDRAAANFCDEFEFKDAETQVKAAAKGEQARNTLDTLFGDDVASERKPKSLDDLFGA